MSVLLLILKIIGITLLSIIGLLLLVILLVLFVPIRYKLYIDKPENGDFYGKVKVTWLIHFINLLVEYKNDLFYVLRITLIPIKKSDNLKKKPSKHKEKIIEKKEDNIDSTNPAETDNSQNDVSNDIELYEPVNYTDDLATSFTDNSEECDDDIDEEKLSIFDKIVIIIKKIIDFLFNIKDKIYSIINKIVEIKDNTEYYIEAINDEGNKRAFSLCLEKLSKILKNIKPRYIKGHLRYGSEDPYDMGKMMSIYGILLPIVRDKIQIVPDYDNEVLEGTLTIKGRITLVVIIWAAVKVYFNKDFKRMMKVFKHN